MYYEDRAPSDDNCCIESIWTADNTYRLSIIGIRDYMPWLAHSFRQSHVTKVTCSPVDALPSGPSSRFRRCSCAIAHAGEKRSPIIGSLRYLLCIAHYSHMLGVKGWYQMKYTSTIWQ